MLAAVARLAGRRSPVVPPMGHVLEVVVVVARQVVLVPRVVVVVVIIGELRHAGTVAAPSGVPIQTTASGSRVPVV